MKSFKEQGVGFYGQNNSTLKGETSDFLAFEYEIIVSSELERLS